MLKFCTIFQLKLCIGKNQNMSNFRVFLLINIKQSPAQMTCIQYGEYTQKFKFLNDKLGNGTCATVMKIAHKQTNMTYALKYAKFDSAEKLAVAFQQIEAVRAISDNPVAIQIYYYFVNVNKKNQFSAPIIELGIIMQLADRSLEQDIYLRRKKQRFFSLSQLQEMTASLINFFACFQRKEFIHRDIKPDNILIMKPQGALDSKSCTNSLKYANKKNPTYKVCDFGFATKRHEFSGKNIAGTATYASPKLQVKFKNSDVIVSGNNYKDDVYSLGVTLIEAGSLQSAEKTPPNKLLLRISQRYGQNFSSVLQCMIQFTQQRRPDFIRLQQLFDEYLISKEIIQKSKQPSTNYKSFSNKLNESISFTQFDNIKQSLSRCIDIDQGNINSTDSSIHGLETSTSDQKNLRNGRPIQIQMIPSVRPNIISNQKKDSYGKLINLQQSPNYMYESYLNPQVKKQQERNVTPNKPTADKLKPTEEKQKQILTMGDVLRSCNDAIVTNDKAKTKRRSKLIQNMNNEINIIRNNIDLSGGNSVQNSQNSKAAVKPKKTSQYIQLSLAQSIQQSSATNVLFKFQQAQKIQLVQIFEMDRKSIAVFKAVACLIAQDCLFICTQNKLGAKRVTFIKFDEKLVGAKFMKYCSKIKRLFIICSNDMIHTLSMDLLSDIINRCIQFNIPYAHSKQFELIQIKTHTSLITAFCVDQRLCEVTKVLKNGEIIEGRNTLAKCPDKMNIAYLRKHQKFLYVATHYGYVARYPQNSGDKVSCMMGCFDFKCTILAMEIVGMQDRTGIAIVTSNGFLVVFTLALQKLGQKHISQTCLKNCKIDFRLRVGRKVIGINAAGEIINERGETIKQTYIDDATQIFVVEEGDKFIVVTQSGTIYEIDMEQIQFWPAETNRKKLIARQQSQIEKGKKKYLQQFMNRGNIPNINSNKPEERPALREPRNDDYRFVKKIQKF